MTLADSIQAIGADLEKKWVDDQWGPSRQLIVDWRTRIRDAMLAGFAQRQFKAFQKPGVLPTDQQKALAVTIASSQTFKTIIPRMAADMLSDLADAQETVAEAVYRMTSERLAAAYHDLTPDGVSFKAVINRDELTALRMNRYEGLTYAESIAMLARDLPQTIRAQVNKNVTEAGTSTTALRGLLDRFGPMFNSFQSKVESTFRQFSLQAYKSAEMDMTKPVKL